MEQMSERQTPSATAVANIRSNAPGVRIDGDSPLASPYDWHEFGRKEAVWRYAMLTHQRVRPTAMPTEYEQHRQRIRALHGKTLLCSCAPAPCHGDVLRIITDAVAAGKTWDEAAQDAISWAWALPGRCKAGQAA